MNIKGVAHLGIAVKDMNAAVGFYEKKLGFRLIHRSIAVDIPNGALEAAFLQLGDLQVELCKPVGIGNQSRVRSGGVLDHFAMDAPDFEACESMAMEKGLKLHDSTKDGSVLYDTIGPAGVKGVNFAGPSGEVVEFCHDFSKSYGNKKGLAGWSHLALKVEDLSRSMQFYEKLGFTKCADGYLDTPKGRLTIGFMECRGFQMEIIQVGSMASEELRKQNPGAIDHVAFAVSGVEEAFLWCRRAGFCMETQVIKELSLFEHGVRFFMVTGPDGERIEFCEKKGTKHNE